MEGIPVPNFTAESLKLSSLDNYECKMLQMREGLVYTLIFIKNETNILLGLKKRGLGKDKWNGFGGKVEQNETIFEGAIRETKEECNLEIKDPKYLGCVTYEELGCKIMDIIHIFTVEKYTNTVQESEEMLPKWFELDNLPYDQMWPDFASWSPFVLNNKYFHAHTIYNKETYSDCIVKEYDSIEKVQTIVDHIIKK